MESRFGRNLLPIPFWQLCLFHLCFSACSTHRVRGPASDVKSRVLIVAAEQRGIFSTGGLGHTIAGLAGALKAEGYSVDVLMPYYAQLDLASGHPIQREGQFSYRFLWSSHGRGSMRSFDLYSTIHPATGVKTYLLRPEEGWDIFDNRRGVNGAKGYAQAEKIYESFAAFGKAASRFIQARSGYDVINTHDWHAGLVGYFMKEEPPIVAARGLESRRLVFTINNMGYQGLTDLNALGAWRPHPALFSPDMYEFYGRFNFLKAGIRDSDAVLTVSPNYQQEILTARFGFGLEGYLKIESQRKPFVSILNGVDDQPWRLPGTHSDPWLVKQRIKQDIWNRLRLSGNPDAPLFVMTSRLSDQKGIHYWPDVVESALQQNSSAVWVVMGDGEAWAVERVKDCARRWPGRCLYLPFDSELEKPLTQAADFFVNLPWYEPSGTNHLLAMAGGTIPIVSDVGGLKDYVRPGQNGFLAPVVFQGNGSQVDLKRTHEAMVETLRQASECFGHPPCLSKLREGAMTADFSWRHVVPRYTQLFSQLRALPSYLLNNGLASCSQGLVPFLRQAN